MELSKINAAETMDSREIATLTGKNHADVCRDIRRMLEELQTPESRFASGYLDAQNQRRNCYLLPKRECLILATGYRVDLRAKVIDRWAELENKAAQPRELSRIEILKMALEAEERREAAETALKAAQPAIRAQERLQGAEGSMGVRAVAKALKVNQKPFVAWLISKKVLYRLKGRLVPHQRHLDAGRFEMRTTAVAHTDGDHLHSDALFTAAGVAWISRNWTMLQPPEDQQKLELDTPAPKRRRKKEPKPG